MNTRSYGCVGTLLLAALGCGDDTGSLTDPAPPTPQSDVSAAVALRFEQVSGGGAHTCGVTAEGQAYCWGYNESGQLGAGTITGPDLCIGFVGPFACSSRPALVEGGHTFRQVTAGEHHTCGVTTSDRAYCWGDNGGKLGDGTATRRPRPVPVAGGHRFRQVDAGFGHTCGVTSDHQVYCWGSDDFGQLGNGSMSAGLTPVAVLGGLQFQLVSAGQYHTCGVTTSSQVYCWGLNRDGQIGDSSTAGRRARPVLVAATRRFRQVDAGGFHTCAVTTANRAFCWGNGRSGQLGNGKTYLSFWPRRVAGSLAFNSVTTGLFHTCGQTTTDRAYCWGSNSHGQVGDGSPRFTIHPTPAAVAGRLALDQVSAGSWHSCGKTSRGLAHCWGDNFFGALGNGESGFDAVGLRPVPVAGSI